MASASVTLREGKSYTYQDGAHAFKFTPDAAVDVTGRELIDKLKTISCLVVTEHQDKPAKPLVAKPLRATGKPVKQPEPEPEPEPEVDEEPELVDDEEPEEQAEPPDEEPPSEETSEVEAEPDEEPEQLPEAKPAKPAKKGNGGKAKAK